MPLCKSVSVSVWGVLAALLATELRSGSLVAATGCPPISELLAQSWCLARNGNCWAHLCLCVGFGPDVLLGTIPQAVSVAPGWRGQWQACDNGWVPCICAPLWEKTKENVRLMPVVDLDLNIYRVNVPGQFWLGYFSRNIMLSLEVNIGNFLFWSSASFPGFIWVCVCFARVVNFQDRCWSLVVVSNLVLS